MTPDKLQSLSIPSDAKNRSQKSVWMIFLFVIAAAGTALFFAWPRASDQTRGPANKATASTKPAASAAAPATTNTSSATPAAVPADKPGDSILTVSGYIVNRERIEISPRFMGVVKWIGVKKGDAVTNGQVVVLLDDAEYQARLRETRGPARLCQRPLRKRLNFNSSVSARWPARASNPSNRKTTLA